MPERLNCAILLEVGDERRTRLEILSRMEKALLCSAERRQALMLMVRGDPIGRWDFPEANDNLDRSLSPGEMLFVYYNDAQGLCGPVISIDRTEMSAAYTISLPNLAMLARPNDVRELIANLYAEIAGMGMHCVVTAGGQLEIDESFRSVADVLQSASKWNSLAEYVCCDKRDAIQLANFTLVQEYATGAVFRRSYQMTG